MAESDPSRKLYRNARREARVVTIVWAAAFVWVIAICYVMGYEHSGDSLIVSLGLASAGRRVPEVVLGFPDWVFWGIMAPWIGCSIFTVWFGLWGMADDDLGAEAPMEGDAHGH